MLLKALSLIKKFILTHDSVTDKLSLVKPRNKHENYKFIIVITQKE